MEKVLWGSKMKNTGYQENDKLSRAAARTGDLRK